MPPSNIGSGNPPLPFSDVFSSDSKAMLWPPEWGRVPMTGARDNRGSDGEGN